MPELCRWGKVVIVIKIDDHAWPHVHARYVGHEASLRLRDLEITDGWLPPRQRREVLRWAREHHAELHEAWESLERHVLPQKIDPPPGR